MSKRLVSPVTATVAALLAALLAPLVAAAQNSNDDEPLFDGEWRYQRSCASCHGAKGEGIYAFGVPLKGDAFVQNAPPQALISVIQLGRYNRNRAYPDYPGMPAFDYIRAAEARALVAYMKGALQE